MHQFLRCERCGEIFDLEDCHFRKEYVDDSGYIAYKTPLCPYCGSESLEDYYDIGEEEEEEDEIQD